MNKRNYYDNRKITEQYEKLIKNEKLKNSNSKIVEECNKLKLISETELTNVYSLQNFKREKIKNRIKQMRENMQ